MANNIDLYESGGELAPYSPNQPLAPVNNDWGRTDVDYLDTRAEQAFNQQDPQLHEVYREIGITIAGDLQRLNHPIAWINAAQNWYAANIGKDPRQERKQHRFNLHDQAGDALAESFGNMCHRVGASQEFVSNCLWLLGEAAKRLTGASRAPAQGRAPSYSSDPTDSLSDAEYEQVLRINESAKAATMGYLKDLWGSSFHANLKMVDNYFNSLPERDKQHLSQYSTGWVVATNTPEIILGLFNQAIGAGTLPSGGAIASEIAEHEYVMKHDRKRWNADERLQARYRELLRMRDQ